MQDDNAAGLKTDDIQKNVTVTVDSIAYEVNKHEIVSAVPIEDAAQETSETADSSQ